MYLLLAIKIVCQNIMAHAVTQLAIHCCNQISLIVRKPHIHIISLMPLLSLCKCVLSDFNVSCCKYVIIDHSVLLSHSFWPII